MRPGIRGKLFIVSLLLLGIAGTTSAVFFEARLRGWFVERVETELEHANQMMAAFVSELDAPPIRQSSTDWPI